MSVPRRHRSALGVLVALWIALVVLVHHDSMAMTHSRDMSAMPMAMAATAEHGAEHGNDSLTSSGDMACSAAVVQHCGATIVDTAKLAPPKETPGASAAASPPFSRGPATARSAERAPPDLSVLSQLRI